MFNKVLVGFDGSERAQDALALGVSLRAPDGELVVCSVHHLDTLSAKLDPEELAVEPRRRRIMRAAGQRAHEGLSEGRHDARRRRKCG